MIQFSSADSRSAETHLHLPGEVTLADACQEELMWISTLAPHRKESPLLPA